MIYFKPLITFLLLATVVFGCKDSSMNNGLEIPLEEKILGSWKRDIRNIQFNSDGSYTDSSFFFTNLHDELYQCPSESIKEEDSFLPDKVIQGTYAISDSILIVNPIELTLDCRPIPANRLFAYLMSKIEIRNDSLILYPFKKYIKSEGSNGELIGEWKTTFPALIYNTSIEQGKILTELYETTDITSDSIITLLDYSLGGIQLATYYYFEPPLTSFRSSAAECRLEAPASLIVLFIPTLRLLSTF